MTPNEFFNSIDYEQLVLQKEVLIRSIYESDEDVIDSSSSILHIIDALQDCAAGLFGEEEVFLFKKKEEYLEKYKNYCMDNRLEDDSKWISTKDLFEFVESEIINEEE